jgi:peroxiredoxin
MSYGRPTTEPDAPISLIPEEGWHCSHLYYRIDRGVVSGMSPQTRVEVADEIAAILDPKGSDAPARLQTSTVSGQKADFGLMILDPDPLKVNSVHQSLLASKLGAAIIPAYSFISMTEVSEYLPTPEQYSQRLLAEGEKEDSPSFAAKVKAYSDRWPGMRKTRLTPDFPEKWTATCFYPMNKMRRTGENWFTLSYAERNKLMSEHARSGIAFAGKVQQLITVGVGLEDWEWGVTLWARNPQFLREIVYRMRFDEASARYGEFGAFYTSYVMSPMEMLRHCRVIS